MSTKPPRKTTVPPSPGEPLDDDYRARLAQKKQESTLQLLFKAARLLDEEALGRVAETPRRPKLRRSHTALFPHIALEGTRITELAEKLEISKQAVSQVVDELEELGVVERVPDHQDARAKLVRFTARGRAGLLDGLAILSALEDEYRAKIGASSMRALHDALAKLLAAVESARSRQSEEEGPEH